MHKSLLFSLFCLLALSQQNVSQGSFFDTVSKNFMSLINTGAAAANYTLDLERVSYIWFELLPKMISEQAELYMLRDYTNNEQEIKAKIDERTFDFIVVGSGSAGAVVANRLSHPNNNYKVLLIEAGGNATFVSTYPALAYSVADNPECDWMYKPEPEKRSCKGCEGRMPGTHIGKVLGGSSNLNFMVYVRGNERSFDLWANLTGDPAWSYKNVLPYFLKSENYDGGYPDAQVHGCGGYLNVERVVNLPGQDILAQAIKEYGTFRVGDVNQNQTNTFGIPDQTTNQAERADTYTAFIKPVLNQRKNLKVLAYSEVTKLIVLNGSKPRVVGVEYLRHGSTEPKRVYAKREVIVSAGSFNTPKILLNSGIGPKDHLRDAKVRVVKDAPGVGQNLQDHPLTMFHILFNTTGLALLDERDLISILGMVQTIKHGYKFLPTNGVMATGFTSSPDNKEGPEFPDLQLIINPIGTTAVFPGYHERLFHGKKGYWADYIKGYESLDGHYIIICLVRPKSKGYVQLNPKNPGGPPIINQNGFSDKSNYDMKALIHGMKLMIDFYENTPAFKAVNATFLPKPLPGCENTKFRSDEYFRCFVEHSTGYLFHPTGTAKMGKKSDPMAVVDSRLRVMGVEGVRVVDASIMPVISNGHINAPTIMIGERGADFIILDNGGVTEKPGSQKKCSF